MELDFSKCKTAKDVNKVWIKHQEQINIIRDFEKSIKEDKLEKMKELKKKEIQK